MEIELKAPCPHCGSTDHEYIYICEVDDSVIGCTDCIRRVDAYTYTEDVEDQSISAHIDACIDAALGK